MNNTERSRRGPMCGFLRNSWYVAAWSNEIGERPFGRRLLDEPVVFYRGASGRVSALEDRCAHRHLPLRLGRVLGENLQCGYHGMLYDSGGACVEVPGQPRVPARARIRAYPVVERHGWVWVWMGEAGAAEASSIPDFHWLEEPRHAAAGKVNYVRCNYQMITENLLDSSHLAFVHRTTIGTQGMSKPASFEVKRQGNSVKLERWVLDVPAPATYLKTGLVHGNIDRWQFTEFVAPAFVRQHVGGADTGTGAPQGRRSGGVGLYVLHAMTPESAAATHYFWAVARDFAPEDAALTQVLFADTDSAFQEDKIILEAQQQAELEFDATDSVDMAADAAALQARRLLRKLIEEEAARSGLASGAVT